ncbi:MAG: hypothetical protein H7227_04845 [Actinobacteria bacterium]|nr:hypothetical protein [Actinomycetota bacterium]
MPTYQYACSACNHEFEVFQAFTDSSLTHCPECGGELKKVYSAVGVVFKGSGFYKTDSQSSNKSSAAPAAPASATIPTPAPAPATPAKSD